MHTKNLSLRDVDASALDYARRLQAGLNGLRLDEGGDGGDGGDGSDGGDGGEGSGSGDDAGDGGNGGQPDLTQQALDAIEALKTSGAQIPDALAAAVNELKNARSEAANYRTQLRDLESKTGQHDQVLQGIAKALGLTSGDGSDDPDPAALKAALDQKDAQLKTQTIELAATKAAPKHGADPVALLDSRSFLEAAAKLDPTADDFSSELDSLVKSTVENNPKLKAGQAPGKGGADFTGGTGDKTAKTLEDAVAARLGG